MSTQLKKALLEGGRVVILTIVSYLLTEGVLATLIGATGLTIDPGVQLIIIGLLTSTLKSLDKYLHLSAESNTGLLGEKGLTGF